jgi:hypothetical protein
MRSNSSPFDDAFAPKPYQRLFFQDQVSNCRLYSLVLGVCFVMAFAYGLVRNEIPSFTSANYRWRGVGQGSLQNRRGSKFQPSQTSLGWVGSLEKGREQNSSQGMQDGILATIFDVIGTENRFFVELGFQYVGGDTPNESVIASTYTNSPTNSYNLFKKGWKGRLFDSKLQHPGIGLFQEVVTGENVVQVFKSHNVPFSVDYVSIDIDSVDFWVLRGILSDQSPYRPRVITVEYNSNFPVQSTVACDPDWRPWAADFVYGSSVGASLEVTGPAGYQPVYIEEGMDLFLVRSDILEAHKARGYTTHELETKWPLPSPMHSRNCDRANISRFVDVKTFMQTHGNMELARRDALLELRRVQTLHNISLCV